MKKIGIIQPGSIGDIMLLLPAMKYLKDQGNHIIWPIYEQHLWMFTEVVDYITFIPVKNDVHTVINESNNLLKHIYKVNEIFDLAATFPNSTATDEYVKCGDGNADGSGETETFDMFKYRKLNIPIDVKWNLKHVIKRDLTAETLLYDKLVKHSKYAVAFLSCSKGKYDIKFDFKDGQLIEATEDYNMFHWIKILENAHTIITLNSGPFIFVECLNLQAKKIIFKIPNPKMQLLRNKWEII